MNNSPITTIIFDLGNVLIKWNLRVLFQPFFSTDEEFNAFMEEVSFYEWNAQQDLGRSMKEAVELIKAQHPRYTQHFDYFYEHWYDSIQERIEENVRLATYLKRAGYPLYILSNYAIETFQGTWQYHPFLDIFDDIIISGEVGAIKPDPAIFHYTLQRIGRTAQECLFIDDSLPNVETARSLGFTAIHFQTPGQLQNDIAKLGIFLPDKV
jgi:2-haloacid dehalogenase